MKFRDLQAQYAAQAEALNEAALRVMRSGTFIGGPEVERLEKTLAEYVGVRHCLSCANGTDALLLVLMAWGIGPGDAVFVPDFTFFATGEVVALVGATPVFVDVDAESFNLCPRALARALAELRAEGRLRPRALIPVDLFGLPAPYPELEALAEAEGLQILEDAAQGFGGSIGRRRAGSFGQAAATSFFPAKPLGCYGDGGAIFTDDDALAELLRSLKAHGKGEDKYENVRVGLNSRLDSLQAAILGVKFEAFVARELDAVERVAAQYAEQIDGRVAKPRVPAGFRSSWAQYTLRLADRAERDGLRRFLQARGIPSMIYYPKPMHRQAAFAPGAQADEAFPAAERLAETVLSLPMHPYLRREETAAVAEAVNAYIGGRRAEAR